MHTIDLVREFVEETDPDYPHDDLIIRRAADLQDDHGRLTTSQVRKALGKEYTSNYFEWVGTVIHEQDKLLFHKALISEVERMLDFVLTCPEVHSGGYFTRVSRLRQTCICLCLGHIPAEHMPDVLTRLEACHERADKASKRVIAVALRRLRANNR